jgi:hypothetical protein
MPYYDKNGTYILIVLLYFILFSYTKWFDDDVVAALPLSCQQGKNAFLMILTLIYVNVDYFCVDDISIIS